MRSVDTNILVRYLTSDDASQYALARDLLETAPIFVGVTVLLETEWVLRDGYGFDDDAIVDAVRALLGLATVTVEESTLVGQAIAWMGDGLEFADAFHLARSRDCMDLVTFDRKFARRANALDAVPVTLLAKAS